jgi:hypothetical protein
MLYRGPFGGGAASGKAGSMVASHNKGGQYIRARTTPTNPRTAQQSAVRNATALLAPQWSSTLTDPQRDAWNVYAVNVSLKNRLGDTINVSGIAMFLRSNVSRIQAGLPIITDAPVLFDLGQTPTEFEFVVAPGATGGTMTITAATTSGWNSSTANHFLLYTSRPQNAGINFFNGPYRLAAVFPGGNTTGSATFTLPFAAGPVGSIIKLQARVTLPDGRLSGAVQGEIFPA